MSLQYKTKAGRLTNLTDARYFNAQGVDWLGFNVDVLAEQSIVLKDLKEIRQWLFEPKIVLECGNHQERTEIIFLANELYAEAVEVGLDHHLMQEDHFVYPIFVHLDFGDLQKTRTRKLLKNQEAIEAIILRDEDPGFNWEKFRKQARGKHRAIGQLKRHVDVLIDLPFQPEWFLEAIELLEPSGIHLRGDKEEKPGLSRVDEYAALLELIESED